MKKHLGYICVSVLFIGCISGSRPVVADVLEPPYYVSLETPLKNRAPVDLSEIGGSITYIPLETSQASLVGKVRKTIITDTLIFIETDPYKLMAFDRSGRFVRNYGNVGRGPGEFTQIRDFAVSPDQSRVYIIGGNQACLTYDIGGNFLNTVKVSGSDLIVYNDSLFVLGNPNIHMKPGQIGPDNDFSVLFSDMNGNVGKTYDYHHDFEGSIVLPVTSLYRSENKIKFLEVAADTLYTVTPEALIPYAAFNLGSEKVSFELYRTSVSSGNDMDRLMESYADKFELYVVREDKEYLYMRFAPGNWDEERDAYGFFDKRTGEIKITDKGGFTNDLDGGLPFFPEYVYNDEVLVDYVDAYVLKEHVASLDPDEMTRLYGDEYKKLVALAKSLEDDSNPVLILVK